MKKKLLLTTIGATSAAVLALIVKNKSNTSPPAEQYTITRRVLILGATSAIAQETAKLFAAAGLPIFPNARAAAETIPGSSPLSNSLSLATAEIVRRSPRATIIPFLVLPEVLSIVANKISSTFGLSICTRAYNAQ